MQFFFSFASQFWAKFTFFGNLPQNIYTSPNLLFMITYASKFNAIRSCFWAFLLVICKTNSALFLFKLHIGLLLNVQCVVDHIEFSCMLPVTTVLVAFLLIFQRNMSTFGLVWVVSFFTSTKILKVEVGV